MQTLAGSPTIASRNDVPGAIDALNNNIAGVNDRIDLLYHCLDNVLRAQQPLPASDKTDPQPLRGESNLSMQIQEAGSAISVIFQRIDNLITRLDI